MKKILLLLSLLMLACLLGRSAPQEVGENNGLQTGEDSKAIIPDPANRVHRAGLLWMNMSNMGMFGNPKNFSDPCTGKIAVSGEMPGGSGTDFLFAGALLFGGYKNLAEVNGAIPFEGPYVTTAYAGWDGNPMPMEMCPVLFNEDESGTTLGAFNELSNVQGKINCLFEEVYDPAASAEEQFNTMYTDKYINTVYTGQDVFDQRDHIPLGIEVKQKSYSWSYEFAQKFIIIDYTLYNRNDESKNIYDFFMGIYLDCDIGMPGVGEGFSADDIGGFVQKWENPIPDPATGEHKIYDMNLAWAADNDGRNYNGTDNTPIEPSAGAPLDGATGVVTVKVLRNPNPNLRYAFNMYVADSNDESVDWGPRWKTGLHGPGTTPINGVDPLVWDYDLTPEQIGYDDTNQDNLSNSGGQPLFGGRTEGRPAGDKGKYMVMSNDEFDYNQYDLIDVDLGRYDDPDYLDPMNPMDEQFMQADKWQEWITPTELSAENPVADGELIDRNDLANGNDTKYILSFGPLGVEKDISFAYDSNKDGVVDELDTPMNKTIWEFQHGDSLKLTMAFIVNENFHTSLDQDPNYSDPDAMDPSDGLDPSLYDNGWYDALNNVIWCERMYDIPMYDTPVNKDGTIKGDGWYGEDVGKDGIYSGAGVTECWWTDPVSEYGGPDKGEANFELDDFTNPFTDIFGNFANSEDNLLPFGREFADENFGVTADGYGYMVKYYGSNGLAPQGSWVRYGFDNGKIDVGDGVPDFSGPQPPPSPKTEIRFEDNDVVVEWNSVEFYTMQDGTEAYSGPEMDKDKFTNVIDFEGYTVKVSPNSNASNFIDLLTIDNVNYAYQNVADVGDFLDIPVGQAEFDSLLANNLSIITAEGSIFKLIPFGDNRDLLGSHVVSDVFEYTSVPASIVINGTETVNYYQYSLRLFNKYLENISYISVVSSDFGDPKMGVPALTSSLVTNMKKVKGVEENENVLPFVTELHQNYPNPFNPETRIIFSLSKISNVKLNIYNVAGQLVEKLVDKELAPGYHSKIFKSYYTLKADGKKISKKMVLVK
jgi:hypothetical protein